MTINWKWISGAAATVATLLAIAAAWVQLGLPIYATKAWVVEQMKPRDLRDLRLRRDLRVTQLYQWERGNPPPRNDAVQARIDRLRKEIAELEIRIGIAEEQ